MGDASSGVPDASAPQPVDDAPTVIEGRAAAREPLAAIAPGQLVGRYVLRERLGQGAMGVVYEAIDPNLNRRVALKILHPDWRHGDGAERLLREAQAMARVSHPNVVTVHDVGSDRGLTFIAMELITGSTLRDCLTADPPPYWRNVLELFMQAGEGLAGAHQAGLIHRDFKPSNVLVDRTGRVRVGDFGLARPFEALSLEDSDGVGFDAMGVSFTESGTIVGTPAYMAPEQILADALDHRADQFSFCVALYEALYRKHPFERLRGVELVEAITTDRASPPPPSGEIPAEIGSVLKRGLSADPDGRFRSMKELLDALAAAAPASLEPGEMVTGRYVVAERIGSGKTSTVYRADDRLHDRQVALKVLSPWLVATRREELQRSAQTIVRLRHDNVVSIVDIGVFRGRLYAVVDLVDGFTFDAWLAREPRPSWQQKLDVLLQAARGLAAAHAAGMVHGGIKPSKVMVDRGGRAKMRDFALWGSVTSGEASAAEMHELQVIATRGGHVLGTPAYLAPEIYAGKPVDFSCDVFAFCLVAHEALYGEAFRCASSDERLAAIAAGLPATAPSGASPAGLYSIIRRGLSANPEDRPRSMDELVGALERIGSARPRWLIAVIIALVGLAVVAAWWAIR